MTDEGFNNHIEQAINLANSNKLKENSLKTYGAKPEEFNQSRETTKKKEYKSSLIAFIIIASIVLGLLGKETINWIYRANEIREADKFMEKKIVSLYEEFNIRYTLSNGNVILIEEDKARIIELSQIFEEKGFDSHEFLYAVYKTGGIESLDRAVKGLGYRNVQQFLFEKYREPDTGQGSLDRFLNNNEVGYVEGVNGLKEFETGKGLGQ